MTPTEPDITDLKEALEKFDAGLPFSEKQAHAILQAARRHRDNAGVEGITTAAQDVLVERKRQIDSEGWTPEHDDEHGKGEMADAAACYALGDRRVMSVKGESVWIWPWEELWWKPKTRRYDLVRAGALILAEIERLDRAAAISAAIGDRGK